MKNRNLFESFKAASRGIVYTFKYHRNFRLLIYIALLVILATNFFDFYLEKWLILLLIIAFILSFELFNTALETLADYVSQNKIEEQIKIIKDISAGSVFLASVFALLLGLLLFLL